MPRLWRQFGFFMRRLLRATLRSRHSPRQIAGGVAVGVFIGFTPTMGCQMITAGLVSTFLRLSRIPAVACDGKLTAYEAKTLEVLGEAIYWERPQPQQPPG